MSPKQLEIAANESIICNHRDTNEISTYKSSPHAADSVINMPAPLKAVQNFYYNPLTSITHSFQKLPPTRHEDLPAQSYFKGGKNKKILGKTKFVVTWVFSQQEHRQEVLSSPVLMGPCAELD